MSFNLTEYKQLQDELNQAEQFFNSISLLDGESKVDAAVLNYSAALKNFDSYIGHQIDLEKGNKGYKLNHKVKKFKWLE